MISACSAAAEREATRPSTGAERAVVSYVTKLAHDHPEAAVALTCSAFAGHRSPQRFARQAHDGWRRLGSLRSVVAHETDDRRFRPLEPAEHSIRVLYTLHTASGRYSGLAAQVNRVHGRWLLCGMSSTRQAHICEQLDVVVGAATDTPPRALLGVASPPRTTLDEDHAVAVSAGTSRAGLLDGWTRTWRLPKFGGMRASAFRYQQGTGAIAFVRADLNADCADASSFFRVSTVPEAIGLRLRGLAWTGVQPLDQGPFVDEMWLVRGSTAIYAAASPLPTGADHASVQHMLDSLDDRAAPCALGAPFCGVDRQEA